MVTSNYDSLSLDMKAALAQMREYCTHAVLHPQKEREDEIFYELINVLLILILEREREARALLKPLPEQAFPGGLIAYVMEARVRPQPLCELSGRPVSSVAWR